MKLKFRCHCGKRFSVPLRARGKNVTCSRCQAELSVPGPTSPRALAILCDCGEILSPKQFACPKCNKKPGDELPGRSERPTTVEDRERMLLEQMEAGETAARPDFDGSQPPTGEAADEGAGDNKAEPADAESSDPEARHTEAVEKRRREVLLLDETPEGIDRRFDELFGESEGGDKKRPAGDGDPNNDDEPKTTGAGAIPATLEVERPPDEPAPASDGGGRGSVGSWGTTKLGEPLPPADELLDSEQMAAVADTGSAASQSEKVIASAMASGDTALDVGDKPVALYRTTQAVVDVEHGSDTGDSAVVRDAEPVSDTRDRLVTDPALEPGNGSAPHASDREADAASGPPAGEDRAVESATDKADAEADDSPFDDPFELDLDEIKPEAPDEKLPPSTPVHGGPSKDAKPEPTDESPAEPIDAPADAGADGAVVASPTSPAGDADANERMAGSALRTAMPLGAPTKEVPVAVGWSHRTFWVLMIVAWLAASAIVAAYRWLL